MRGTLQDRVCPRLGDSWCIPSGSRRTSSPTRAGRGKWWHPEMERGLSGLSISTAQLLGRRSLKLVGTGKRGNVVMPTQRTFLALCGSSSEYSFARLIRTFEPLKVPSRAWPIFRRESGSVHDSGKISRVPHISLSSCRSSWNAWLVGSEIPARTYGGVGYRSSLR